MPNTVEQYSGRSFQNSPAYGKNLLGRDVTDKFFEIKTDDAPLLALLNRKQIKTKPTENLKFEHYTRQQVPVSFRLEADITATDTTFKVTPSIAAMLVPQTLIQNDNTGETMEVISRVISTGIVTVKRAVGASDESGAVNPAAIATTLHTFLVLHTMVKEGVGTQEAYAVVPDHHENNIGMYQTDLDISELATAQQLVVGNRQQLSDLRKLKMLEHKKKLEHVLWKSPRIFEQTGTGLKASTGGVDYYLKNCPNNANITPAIQSSFEDSGMAIGDSYRKIRYYGNADNIFAFGGYRFKDFLSKIAMSNASNSFAFTPSTKQWGGYDVSDLVTPYGTLKFVYAPTFDTMDVGGNDRLSAKAYLLNLDQMWLRTFGADGLTGQGLVYHQQYDQNQLDMKGRKEYYYSNFGLQMGYKEAHAVITLTN